MCFHQKIGQKMIDNAPLVYNASRNTIYSTLVLLWQMSFTAFCLYLSLSDNGFVWLVGQILLGIALLQWFLIEHDIGHHGFMPSKSVSFVFGHLASLFLFVALPSVAKNSSCSPQMDRLARKRPDDSRHDF